MGGNSFYTRKSAKTAEVAFKALVEEARHEHGHGGYTGSIAEKFDFLMVELLSGETPAACVLRCVNDECHWSNEKWEAAACIDTGPDPKEPGNRIFLFFGVASS
jgi:hypothetical protein